MSRVPSLDYVYGTGRTVSQFNTPSPMGMGGLRLLRGDGRIRGGRQFELGDGSLDSSGVWQAKKHGDKPFNLNIRSMLGTDF